MAKFYVFIKCELGHTYAVGQALLQTIAEAVEVASVSGQYDILAQFVVPDDVNIGQFVNERVQGITGIRDTYTMIAFTIFDDRFCGF
ncbi:Lrp/AsnC ligand binding domain-containing protein [Parapedomonas caeni]|mgnify:CR=1 FL=1